MAVSGRGVLEGGDGGPGSLSVPSWAGEGSGQRGIAAYGGVDVAGKSRTGARMAQPGRPSPARGQASGRRTGVKAQMTECYRERDARVPLTSDCRPRFGVETVAWSGARRFLVKGE